MKTNTSNEKLFCGQQRINARSGSAQNHVRLYDENCCWETQETKVILKKYLLSMINLNAEIKINYSLVRIVYTPTFKLDLNLAPI